jgi:hypothetical protein
VLLSSLGHTRARTPVFERPACSENRYIHSTQQTQANNVHALSGFRNRTCNHHATVNLPFTLCGTEIGKRVITLMWEEGIRLKIEEINDSRQK